MLYGMLKHYRALIIFDSVGQAFRAEKLLQRKNCPSALVATPRSLRSGCNRALCFPLACKDAIEDLIEARVVFRGCYEAKEDGFVGLGEPEKTKKSTNRGGYE